MTSYITSISVEKAWGGKVSQHLELLSIEEARKALFIRTLSSRSQVDPRVRNIPFSSKLFNFEPENLVTVLYGANGSGKTTLMKMADGLISLLNPVLEQAQQRSNSKPSVEDILDWRRGEIPEKFRDRHDPNRIKFTSLDGNYLINAVKHGMSQRKGTRTTSKKFDFDELSVPWLSKTCIHVEGVCETPDLYWLGEDEIGQMSMDSKFKIKLNPLSPPDLDLNGIFRGGKKIIQNFEGAFYALDLKIESFGNAMAVGLADEGDAPVFQFKDDDDAEIHTINYQIPILIHPREGILVLCRTVMNFTTGLPNEPRFAELSEDFNEEIYSGSGEMALLPYVVESDDLTDFFPDITSQPLNKIESQCAFTRHMVYDMYSGIPCDFFLAFCEQPKYRGTGGGKLNLPSLLDPDHFEEWNNALEGDVNCTLEFGVDRCYPHTLKDLTASLQSQYIWPSNYTPVKSVMPPKEGGQFLRFDAPERPATYSHPHFILMPPGDALEGTIRLLSSVNAPHKLENMYDSLVEILSILPGYSQDTKLFGDSIGSFLFGEFPDGKFTSKIKGPKVHSLDWLLKKYAEVYSKNHGEGAFSEAAAKVEVRTLIKNGLEQIWFQSLEQAVVRNRFALMNKILKKYLDIHCKGGEMNPNRLWYGSSAKSLSSLSKPNIKMEELSSGMRNLFNLIMALGNTDCSGPIFIDEPEISLHIDWEYALKDIATQLADSTKRQVIFSSHSPDLIMNFGDRSVPFVSENEHDGE